MTREMFDETSDMDPADAHAAIARAQAEDAEHLETGRFSGLHQGAVKDRWMDDLPSVDRILLRALALVSGAAAIVIAAAVAKTLGVL